MSNLQILNPRKLQNVVPRIGISRSVGVNFCCTTPSIQNPYILVIQRYFQGGNNKDWISCHRKKNHKCHDICILKTLNFYFNLFYEFCIYEHLHDFCVFVVILSRYYFTNILFKYAWMTAFELDDNY